MADEATVRTSLTIKKGSLFYTSQPSAFTATQTGEGGPTPGQLMIPTTGRSIYLTELSTPGLCRIQNLDDTNYVEWGIFDTLTNKFHPLGELLPGETYVFRLSRNLSEQYTGSGTGTTAPENYWHFKANFAACPVLVEAFEK